MNHVEQNKTKYFSTCADWFFYWLCIAPHALMIFIIEFSKDSFGHDLSAVAIQMIQRIIKF